MENNTISNIEKEIENTNKKINNLCEELNNYSYELRCGNKHYAELRKEYDRLYKLLNELESELSEEKRKETATYFKGKILRIKEIFATEVIFDDGSILTSEHRPDCCENHYIDFSNLALCNLDVVTGETINIYEREFDFSNRINFGRVDGVGVLLYDTKGSKYLCNGYGYNNGYYSTDIDLVLKAPNGEVAYLYDVSECQDIEW